MVLACGVTNIFAHLSEVLLSCFFQALDFFLKAEEGNKTHLLSLVAQILRKAETTLSLRRLPLKGLKCILTNAKGCYVFFFSVDPNFYSKNLLMLGKTYMAMKDKEKALLWLTKAKEYPGHTLEDKEVHTHTETTSFVF